MEAKKLSRKKSSISKGKIKKTIKNVICRPDPAFWPLADEKEATQIILLLNKHSVDVPVFKKLPWKELKLIPKEKRPKQPPIPKVSGLIFGLSECQQSIEKKECSALLIEASISPKTIVQPLITNCYQSNIPILCMPDLKMVCAKNFGISTSCLGIQKCLKELPDTIETFCSSKKPKNVIDTKKEVKDDIDNDKMDLETDENVPTFAYLYRTSKKSRIFIPSSQVNTTEFTGQQYIQFAKKDTESDGGDKKKYMKMLLKRMSNNPNKRKVISE